MGESELPPPPPGGPPPVTEELLDETLTLARKVDRAEGAAGYHATAPIFAAVDRARARLRDKETRDGR